MASLDVRDAVDAKIAADLPALPYINTRNNPADPKALPQQWFTVEYIELDEEQVAFGDPGNNCFRETGVIVFKIADHVGKGETWMLTTAETIRDAFRTEILGPGIFLGAAGPPATGPEDDEGPHKFTRVPISFQHDYRR